MRRPRRRGRPQQLYRFNGMQSRRLGGDRVRADLEGIVSDPRRDKRSRKAKLQIIQIDEPAIGKRLTHRRIDSSRSANRSGFDGLNLFAYTATPGNFVNAGPEDKNESDE